MANLADILAGAASNIEMVAEAEARLAAAGKTSLATWEKQARAVEYLTGRMKQQQAEQEKLSRNTNTLRDAMKGAQTSMLAVAATTAATFAELRSMAGHANPGLLRAFDGALGILQARLGGALLPEIDATIDAVMDVADWFANLSDGTKKLIAGGLVAVPAIIGLSAALRALSPVLTLAAAATRQLTAAAQANVMTSRMAGATLGGLGILGAAAYFLGQNNAPAETSGQKVSEEEAKHATKLAETLGIGGSLQDQAARFRHLAKTGQRNFFWTNKGYYTRLDEGEAAQTADILERMSTGGVQNSDEGRARRQIQRQAMRVSAVQMENRPAYSALAQARQQLQIGALGKDRYQLEILKEQRKHREEEIKKLDELLTEFKNRFPQGRLMD